MAFKKVSLALVILLSLTFNQAAIAESSVTFDTDLGSFTITLYDEKAPATVENFLQYADSGFYNGTIFHRIVPGFVVQGGGHTFDFSRKKPRDPVVNESIGGMLNKTATVAMARTSDPDSATSQFFINLKNNGALNAEGNNHGYTVFGKVTGGMGVVRKMVKEPRGLYRRWPDAPNMPIRILDTQIHKPE